MSEISTISALKHAIIFGCTDPLKPIIERQGNKGQDTNRRCFKTTSNPDVIKKFTQTTSINGEFTFRVSWPDMSHFFLMLFVCLFV